MYSAYFLTLVGAVFLSNFLVVRDKNGSMKAVVLKTCTSLLFIAVGIIALNGKPSEVSSAVLFPSLLIIIGLVLGLVGDVFLDLKIYYKSISVTYLPAAKDSDLVTYFGMIAFGIGHVFYIVACSHLYNIGTTRLLWAGLGAVFLTTIIFLISITILKLSFGKFLIPAAVYAILLCFFIIVTLFSISSAGLTRASVLLLSGSILFFLSDLILSLTYFSKPEAYLKTGPLNPESRLIISVNHIFYYGAQFSIALALGFL